MQKIFFREKLQFKSCRKDKNFFWNQIKNFFCTHPKCKYAAITRHLEVRMGANNFQLLQTWTIIDVKSTVFVKLLQCFVLPGYLPQPATSVSQNQFQVRPSRHGIVHNHIASKIFIFMSFTILIRVHGSGIWGVPPWQISDVSLFGNWLRRAAKDYVTCHI